MKRTAAIIVTASIVLSAAPVLAAPGQDTPRPPGPGAAPALTLTERLADIAARLASIEQTDAVIKARAALAELMAKLASGQVTDQATVKALLDTIKDLVEETGRPQPRQTAQSGQRAGQQAGQETGRQAGQGSGPPTGTRPGAGSAAGAGNGANQGGAAGRGPSAEMLADIAARLASIEQTDAVIKARAALADLMAKLASGQAADQATVKALLETIKTLIEQSGSRLGPIAGSPSGPGAQRPGGPGEPPADEGEKAPSDRGGMFDAGAEALNERLADIAAKLDSIEQTDAVVAAKAALSALQARVSAGDPSIGDDLKELSDSIRSLFEARRPGGENPGAGAGGSAAGGELRPERRAARLAAELDEARLVLEGIEGEMADQARAQIAAVAALIAAGEQPTREDVEAFHDLLGQALADLPGARARVVLAGVLASFTNSQIPEETQARLRVVFQELLDRVTADPALDVREEIRAGLEELRAERIAFMVERIERTVERLAVRAAEAGDLEAGALLEQIRTLLAGEPTRELLGQVRALLGQVRDLLEAGDAPDETRAPADPPASAAPAEGTAAPDEPAVP